MLGPRPSKNSRVLTPRTLRLSPDRTTPGPRSGPGVPIAERQPHVHVDTLGLEKRLDVSIEQLGGRWIEVAPRGAPISIALVLEREGVPSGVETGIRLRTRTGRAPT